MSHADCPVLGRYFSSSHNAAEGLFVDSLGSFLFVLLSGFEGRYVLGECRHAGPFSPPVDDVYTVFHDVSNVSEILLYPGSIPFSNKIQGTCFVCSLLIFHLDTRLSV